MEPQNRFEIDGNVLQMDGDKVTVKVITPGPRGKHYEDLLLVTVPEELAKHVKVGEMQSFGGQYIRAEGEETVLQVTDVCEADGYYNFCKVAAELYNSKFFKAVPKEGKKQFTTLFLQEFKNTLNGIGAVAFNALSNTLAPEAIGKGSLIVCAGKLSRKAFNDGTGRWNTDILLDPAETKVEFRAEPRKFREPGQPVEAKAKAKRTKKA